MSTRQLQDELPATATARSTDREPVLIGDILLDTLADLARREAAPTGIPAAPGIPGAPAIPAQRTTGTGTGAEAA